MNNSDFRSELLLYNYNLFIFGIEILRVDSTAGTAKPAIATSYKENT